MLKYLPHGLATVSFVLVVAFAAFGGAKSALAAPPVITPTATTVACGASIQLTATGTAPFTWSATVAGLSSTTGATVAYTAPTTGAPLSVVITATDASAAPNSSSVTISITCSGGAPNYCSIYGTTACNPCGLYGYGYGGYNCGVCGYAGAIGCNNLCGSVYNAGCFNNCGNLAYGNLYGCGTNCNTGYVTNYPYANCANPCSNYSGVLLNCSTGYGQTVVPTSRISIQPGPNSATCGGAVAITATLVDGAGFRVPDGTLVNFSTTLGYISTTDSTQGGTAYSSLTIPPGLAGTAQVTVSSAGASAQTNIAVSCSTPTTPLVTAAAPLAPAPAPQIRPIISPPSTGDGGLR